MSKPVYRQALLTATALAAGCAPIAGQWELVRVEPEGAAFPFSSIQFAEDGSYRSRGQFTATGEPSLKNETTVGLFEKSRNFLRLTPRGNPAIGLSTRRTLDGKLAITLKPPGRDWRVTGFFERAEPIDPRLRDPDKPITPESLTQDQSAAPE